MNPGQNDIVCPAIEPPQVRHGHRSLTAVAIAPDGRSCKKKSHFCPCLLGNPDLGSKSLDLVKLQKQKKWPFDSSRPPPRLGANPQGFNDLSDQRRHRRRWRWRRRLWQRQQRWGVVPCHFGVMVAEDFDSRVMADSFLSIIAETLLKNIISPTIKQTISLLNASDLKRLEETITYIKAVLLDAENLQQHNQTLRLSLTKLRGVFYDAEDVLDEFRCDALRKELKTERMFKFFRTDRMLFKVIGTWDTHSFMTFKVLGRDHDKENIIDLLVLPRGVETMTVIPIVGIGGLGKTTLAQFVYNDERVSRSFPLKLWVCVSEFFDVARLLCEIIFYINHENMIVYRSMHYRVKWDELKAILMKLDYLHQSKIVVTTRGLAVASIMGTQGPFELEALGHEDSLSLLLKWAFNQGDEERYPNLLRIADEIVKKCKGVPLAVRTMGSLLYGKTRQRDWELDTTYDTDYIIQCWLANGFLQSPVQEDDVCCEDIGLQYFKDLWSKGFVQDVDDKVTFYYFKIHDLIHDFALNVSQEECLTIYQQTISASENVRHLAFAEHYPMRTRQPYLKKLKGVRTLVILTPPAQFREVEKTFLSACISYFKYLRLIQFQVSDNLRRLINLRFLEISGDNMQLREVRPGLKNFIIRDAPSLRDLPRLLLEASASHLEFIEIRGCPELEALPNWFQNLISLQRLEIIDCPKLSSLFDGVEYLTSLKQLKIQ
ncbi:Leucine-rich repeat containing protein isoform 1 [Gossypium australe]|uniref:Leucine-rich repeat containing protein isoform 1 n=1 Tax=Gossypium australe TaxID=47621 RepID=A0A5B6VV06_9ROSI|nr:Leucine-rich repeat containing protein isoform 1 [Gossypium australe]